MLDDVGLVIRRARRMPPLDAEDFEEADRDGQCDCLHIEGGHGMFACYGTIGTDVDMFDAMEALHADAEVDNIVASLGVEFGARTDGLINGSSPTAIREITDDIAAASRGEMLEAALLPRPMRPRTHERQALHMIRQELPAAA